MMNNHELDHALKMLDSELKKQGISRRDAIKMAGLGSAAFMMGGTQANAATSVNASTAKGKIVIIGGGLAGMSTAAKLTNSLSNPDITIIEPNPQSVSYQPGQTLIGAGLWKKSDIMYIREDFLPDGVNLVKDKVMDVDAPNNMVMTEGGQKISYDYLIVAAGVKLNYAGIKGLEEIGEAYSIGNNKRKLDVLGNSGINSVYTADGAEATWKQMQKLISEAKSGKKVNALFTHPNTPIKCGGAPKKIMYLTDARLREAGARDNANLHFYPNGGAMFGVKEYHDAIVEQYKERDMNYSYNHNLSEVDISNKIAVFDKHFKVKGAWDEDLEEYEEITKHERVEVPFDFLHVTPPMKAPDELGKSSVGSSKGWIPVNKETLQHVKYKNVFSLGDIAAVPMGKTGGSARKQYKVVSDNIIAMMEGKELTSKYDGYTVCPLITGIGTVMLAEFNWTKKPTPSFPLDPTQERWIWWLLKVYALKPMTIYGMLSGKA